MIGDVAMWLLRRTTARVHGRRGGTRAAITSYPERRNVGVCGECCEPVLLDTRSGRASCSSGCTDLLITMGRG